MKEKNLSPCPKLPSGLKVWKNKILFGLIISLFITGFIKHLEGGRLERSVSHDSFQVKESSHLACPYVSDIYQTEAFYSSSDPESDSGESRSLPKSSRQARTINIARGLIIPHHLLARDLIIRAFVQIDPNYQTVVLIGPNHQNLGSEEIQMSAGRWQTKFGILAPEEKLIDQLEKNKLANIAEDNFNTEHSICGLVSFLKIYFPEAKIVPLILKSDLPKEKTKLLADYLAKNCRNCLFIASVDFSHEVTQKQAEENDRLSIGILQNLDQSHLNDVIVDSLPTLDILLSVLKEEGIKTGKLIERSDSAKISGENLTTVTSYITMLFFE